ncbi:MAG: hypothetical protein ACXW3D_03095 [Caulobacteraceae bacterium]
MAASDISIGGAVRFSWAFLRANARALWGVLALTALAYTIYFAGDLSRNPGMLIAGFLAVAILNLIVSGAVFRLTLGDRHPNDPDWTPGAMGLQWRGIETRLLGASLLFALLFAFIGFLVLIALGAVVVGVLTAKGVDMTKLVTPELMAAAMQQQMGPAFGLVPVLLLAVMAYVGIRLWLMLPASADQGAIRIFKTWKRTKGLFLRMLLSALAIQLPVLLIGAFVAAGVLGGTPQAAGAGRALTAAVLMGVLSGAVIAPLQAAMTAYFYRHTYQPGETE